MTWVESLPIFGSGLIIVGGFLALTVLIGVVVDFTLPHQIRLDHNELAGFILAVIGVVYAVLLGFVALSVWERFDQAEARTYDEAGSLAIVYRDVAPFGQAKQLRDSIREYAHLVIEREWPAMLAGSESQDADAEIERVDAEVRALPVRTMAEEDLHQQALAAINEALLDRDTRLSMDATGINPLMWGVLLIGGVVTVGFTFLFGFRHLAMRYVMTGSLGILIGLVLFLTVAMDYPFRGGITVGPEAFERALDTFKIIGS